MGALHRKAGWLKQCKAPSRFRVPYRLIDDRTYTGFSTRACEGMSACIVRRVGPHRPVLIERWLAEVGRRCADINPECRMGHGLDPIEFDSVLHESPPPES